VRRGQRWGVIDVQGADVIPATHQRIEWDDAIAGWQVQTADGLGVLTIDGQPRVAPLWDRIDVASAERWLRVERNQKVGMLSWDGADFLPCEYDALEIVVVQRMPGTSAAPHIVAQRAAHSGLLDENGAVVLPFDFASIEAIEPHAELDARIETPHLLRITARRAGSRPHAGVFDLCAGTWLVACEYDCIWLIALPAGHGFLVARRCFDGGARFRVGVLGSDGATLIAPEYAWIGDNTALTSRDAREHVCEAICFGWLRGRPVQAQRAEGAELVWLYANGACSQADHDHAATTLHRRAMHLNG
jgi:hypothetical protein